MNGTPVLYRVWLVLGAAVAALGIALAGNPQSAIRNPQSAMPQAPLLPAAVVAVANGGPPRLADGGRTPLHPAAAAVCSARPGPGGALPRPVRETAVAREPAPRDRAGEPRDAPLARLLDAIWRVETRRGADLRRGDGGRAAGHLQQHRAHWERGCRALGVEWHWPQATADVAKCRAVAVANWRLDCPGALAAGDAEELVRHFRLPGAPWRADNDDYARRVMAVLEAGR